MLGPGLTALTGETGAGKTLLVEAIELLVGGRADAVDRAPRGRRGPRRGSLRQADGDELVLARVIPADGRSRAYVDGRLATVGELAEAAPTLVDLHGQHAHQIAAVAGDPARGARRLRRRRSRPAARGTGAPHRDRRRARGARRRRAGTGARGRPAAVPGRRDRRCGLADADEDSARSRGGGARRRGSPPRCSGGGNRIGRRRRRGARRDRDRTRSARRTFTLRRTGRPTPATCLPNSTTWSARSGPRESRSTSRPSGWPRSVNGARYSRTFGASTATTWPQ